MDYDSGEKDLFNLNVDSAARREYENAHGTTEADPDAHRDVDGDDNNAASESSASEENSSLEETLESTESSSSVTAATGVTGINGGPGVTPQRSRESHRDSEETVVNARETVSRETTERSKTHAETSATETQATAPTPSINGPGSQLHTAPIETNGPGAGLAAPDSGGQVIPRPGVH